MLNIVANPRDMQKAKRAMRALEKFSKTELSTEIKRAILEIDMSAKQKVTIGSYKNAGNLKRSIRSGARGKLAFVEAGANYAPYVEFGTGGSYSGDEIAALGIPETYAAQFKGRSQDRVHLPARPFLFNSVRNVIPKMYKRILVRLNKIYNKS